MADDFACPHCGEPTFVTPAHVCADKEPWTRAEKDAWRDEAKRRDPRLQFVAVFQGDRFGGRR